jgi:hypothetical protein
MADWQLAQLNIAQLQAPIDSPQLADFVANLDRINALAENANGFVWRLKGDPPTDLPNFGFDPEYIVNLSVWDSVESLHDFVYKSAHVEIMRRKKEWFNRMIRSHMVLWWVPAGLAPTAVEAKDQLAYLQEHGPTRHAFTFRQAFVRPDKATLG